MISLRLLAQFLVVLFMAINSLEIFLAVKRMRVHKGKGSEKGVIVINLVMMAINNRALALLRRK